MLEASAMLTLVCSCLIPGPCHGNNSHPPAFIGPRPIAPPPTLPSWSTWAGVHYGAQNGTHFKILLRNSLPS